MASSTAAIAVPSSTTLPEAKSARPQVAASPQCVGLPTLTPAPTAAHSRPQNREGWKSMASCRRIARSVMAMATGDAVAEVGADISSVGANISGVGTDISDITKSIVEAWDKIEDKYAVTSLAVAGVVALVGASGVISAVEQLPLVPGALEVVGIGYTGWFAYRNLIYKPDRQALIQKIKDTWKNII
ncbi:protein CURVATURE THYLAKOID 1B, chloroplastic-like [Nymphaea colorata]|nr:protein CURVATURE THYLAKOID 1B, chloroplastic-like [Nymphaea colorata]